MRSKNNVQEKEKMQRVGKLREREQRRYVDNI